MQLLEIGSMSPYSSVTTSVKRPQESASMDVGKSAHAGASTASTRRYNSAAPEAAITPAEVWLNSTFVWRVDKSNRTTTWAVQPEMLKPTVIRWRNDDPGGWWYKVVSKRDEIELTAGSIWEITTVT